MPGNYANIGAGNHCYHCGATNFLNWFQGKWVCEKCMIWFDYDPGDCFDEEEKEGETEH